MKRLPLYPRAEPPGPLPPLYAAWMDELLGAPLPDEVEATCGDCAMLAREGDAVAPGDVVFDPGTRCCTYLPALPNFLVGRALADEDPSGAPGRASLRARMGRGEAVTPLGMAVPKGALERYEDAKRADRFGRSPDLRCPHYVESPAGNCGLWRHRNATCATWYCKHVRGGVGMAFWSRLGDLLASVEARLARWCVLSLDPGEAALAALFPPSAVTGTRGVVAPPDERAAHRALWGRWAGREEAFYRACAELVAPLRWAEVRAIAGADVTLGERLALDAHAALDSDALPAAPLRPGDVAVHPSADGRVRVRGYSNYDPLDVPPVLTAVLERFDGRPTDEVLAALRAEGVVLEPALVRRLVDFELLRPVGET